jgi:hypothetical protein
LQSLGACAHNTHRSDGAQAPMAQVLCKSHVESNNWQHTQQLKTFKCGCTTGQGEKVSLLAVRVHTWQPQMFGYVHMLLWQQLQAVITVTVSSIMTVAAASRHNTGTDRSNRSPAIALPPLQDSAGREANPIQSPAAPVTGWQVGASTVEQIQAHRYIHLGHTRPASQSCRQQRPQAQSHMKAPRKKRGKFEKDNVHRCG